MLLPAPDGYSTLQVPFVKGLPFSRPFELWIMQLLARHEKQRDATEVILVVGAGANLTTEKEMQTAIGEPCTFVRSFQQSKLEGQRLAGIPSLMTVAYIPVKKTAEGKLAQMKRPGALAAVPLPISAFECRVAERLHLYHDVEQLQKHVDEYMDELDRLERGPQADLVDAEGFTKVIGPGRKPAIVQKSALALPSPFLLRSTAEAKANKKRKGGQEEDFYRFQIRQKRQQDFEIFKQQQQEDLDRIAEMKRNKRFKLK